LKVGTRAHAKANRQVTASTHVQRLPAEDPDAADRARTVVGVLIAICAALVGSSTLSQHTPVAWVAFVGPLAAGLILACMPRTCRFGVGLFLGLFVTLIVCGGPLTCVALIA
jgi:hypothetical protein